MSRKIARKIFGVLTGRQHRSTYVDDVLAGRALAADIHDYIARWHDAPEGSPESKLELHEYLGMSWDEYRLWAEKPSSIRYLLAAREEQKPVEVVLRRATLVGAAARSSDATEAERVLLWLQKQGRISSSSS
jgi:hypothetical protein